MVRLVTVWRFFHIYFLKRPCRVITDSKFNLFSNMYFVLPFSKNSQLAKKKKKSKQPKSNQTIEREPYVATFYNTTHGQQPGVENPCARSITNFLWSYWLCKSLWENHQFLTTPTSLFIWIGPHTARMTQFTRCVPLQNKICSLKLGKT